MTVTERATWVQLAVLPLVALCYLGTVLWRAARMPVEEVSWVAPMILAIVLTIVVVIIGTITSAIASHVRAAARGETADLEEGDIRDQQIELLGAARAHRLTGLGGAAALVVAMAGAHPMWIATTLFVTGTLGETYGVIVKLHSYQRGF